MQSQEAYGVEETLDFIKALVDIREGWLEAKEDDGKVSRLETVNVVLGSFPAVVKAAQGIGEIPKELGDLSDEELDRLRSEGYDSLVDNRHVGDAVFYASKLGQAIDLIIAEKKGERLPSLRDEEIVREKEILS